MKTYLIKTAPLAVDSIPYVLIDRVLVRAKDSVEAKNRALSELAARNSEYLIACMVDGTDPMVGLTAYEWRVDVPAEPGDDLVDVLLSTEHGALDLKLAFRAQKLQRQNTLLRRRCALLVGLAILFGAMATVSCYLLNERTEELIRTEGTK